MPECTKPQADSSNVRPLVQGSTGENHLNIIDSHSSFKLRFLRLTTLVRLATNEYKISPDIL